MGDNVTTFEEGAFSLKGNLPPVVSNAFLVKGLFKDSIPTLLQQQKEWVTASAARKEVGPPPSNQRVTEPQGGLHPLVPPSHAAGKSAAI